MSIDHGKLLALADEISATVDHCSPSSTLRHEWAERLRALAQPAEAVEGLREFIAAQRPLQADMAAFVSENWHKYADFPNPPTDAAQGAVAWMNKHGSVMTDELKQEFLATGGGFHVGAAGYDQPLYTHPQAAPAQGGGDTAFVDSDADVRWAVDQWHMQVAQRPLVNRHRRSLDDVWRQVIRHFGGDDVMLCGPCHDDLLADAPSQGGES